MIRGKLVELDQWICECHGCQSAPAVALPVSSAQHLQTCRASGTDQSVPDAFAGLHPVPLLV